MALSAFRIVIGIVLGFALGVGVVFAGDMLHHALFPVPDGIDITRPQDRARLATEWPWYVFGFMVVLWGVAAFVASAVAGLAASRGPWPAWIAGGAMAAATGLNLLLINHPAWVWPAAGASLAIGIGAGVRFGAPRRPS